MRYFLVTLLSLVVLVIAVIAIALNFVFTPAKLSPMIEKVVNENLNAHISLNSVELTFFSTFPNFSVVVRDGMLETLQNDTIVAFEKLDVAVDPIALLRNNSVVVRRVEFVKPMIHAFVDENGVANWDVAKANDELEEETDSVAFDKKTLNISLSNIRIVGGTIIFDDRVKKVYGRLKNVNLNLDGHLAKELSDVKVAMSFTNGLFWQDGKLLAKNIHFSAEAKAELNRLTNEITIEKASVEVNSVKFEMLGTVSRDSLNIDLSLKVPTLDSVLGLVSFIDQSAKVTTSGAVRLDAKIKGHYREGHLPIADVTLTVDDGALHYDGYPNGIENLKIQAHAHLNFKGDSRLVIDNFSLLGVSTSINLKATVESLFHNPILTYSTNSTINLTELSSTIPLLKDIKIAGKARLNSRGVVNEAQIKNGDYAKIAADGEVKLIGVVINIPNKIESKFDEVDIVLSNNKNGLLAVNATLHGVSVRDSANNRLSWDSMSIIASGQNQKDTAFVGGTLDYKNLKISLKDDSLALASGHSSVDFQLSKYAKLKFHTDTLHLRAVDNVFDMSAADVNVTVGKDTLRGKVGFKNINITIPAFPLPISMPNTVVTVDNHRLALRKATLQIGDSDIEITGSVENLVSSSSGEKPLIAKVDVHSSMLNLTQIVHTLNRLDTITHREHDADTAALRLFKIPNNIHFDLNTNLKHVEFGALVMNDVSGGVTIKDGVARLNDLTMEALGAKLGTTVVYDSNGGLDSAKVGLILASRAIDVHSVIQLIPSLDTLMPMLNSFEGKLNFRLIADTKFYEGFTINPKEIQATIALRGENMVLLDGQTFSEISKLLMFKNKQRNVVDSIGVQMAVHDGVVEVFPFLAQIDRYRVAIGGEHFLTNDFSYHISILKSPMPFKFGVNISGSLDDLKVGIGKTQYKSLNHPTSVREMNPRYLELGKEIEDRIRKL